MHLLIRLTKGVFGNALCASIIGHPRGPIYPGILSMTTEVLPDEVHLVSMSLMYVDLFLNDASINDQIFPRVTTASVGTGASSVPWIYPIEHSQHSFRSHSER